MLGLYTNMMGPSQGVLTLRVNYSLLAVSASGNTKGQRSSFKLELSKESGW